ncbi:MAG: hypothetical protein A3F82_05900 [Deltaproteobacteria bacterium RIFCSPLOWO2_12_FULL_44_12]|nr:MAG: hypothetical protein A3D22_04070 [Deltaproteobacteria bacterium RIFCSPHIGHO2_02_FULL_44_53]OGQ27168.1 MAG: hypothetical protein A3D98_01995 [Deltaproteobacteria bacterium RIFCSPHIGHO2_12_FULL_44_21]OGQ31726.1 MAG: hypothetical protein A2979_05230 [Deltaproteobacteria bacterium RIFCSPLOWO2_01_FULL_45_74]OGQ69963.1 MAG: hypothetical protein A3F82_05900 [Deltaproteobacteria bacterium RIFCSPLOWO2_12_FULL_44_12]
MKKLLWIILILAGVAAVAWWQHERIPFLKHFFHREMVATKYTCPMHPQIITDQPGSCPICGMTLVPIIEEKEKATEHKRPEGTFRLTPERRQTIGVKIAEVIQKPLFQEARLPGRVAFDQELYVTQKEYVEALKLGGESELLKTFEKKLERLGLSEDELKALKKTRKVDESLFLPKKDGSFWVYAPVYEADLSWITKEMKAEIGLPSNPNIVLEGVVKQIEPILDPMTRTSKARILVLQSPQLIKPETYVDVVIKKDLGEVLSIPADAVVDTGTRQVVFVDLGEGYIEPRELSIGPKAGTDYPVMKGLEAGEKVITSAHFLLDSESQIQAALKKFGEPIKGHH